MKSPSFSSAALPGFLHPLPFDPTALFHPVEQRIERGDVELQDAIRTVAELSGCDYNSARAQLEAADWNLREVLDKIGNVKPGDFT